MTRLRHPPAYSVRRAARRTYLFAYDVSPTNAAGRRRLRAAAAACEAAGRRVQWSVFECHLTTRELIALRSTLLGILEIRTDRLVVVPYGAGRREVPEEYGPAPTAAAACVVEA